MTAYALAQVHAVEFGADIAEYLRRIDATLEPYGVPAGYRAARTADLLEAR